MTAERRRMRLAACRVALAIVLALIAAPLAAYEFRHGEARLVFRVPDQWSIQRSPDGLVAQDARGRLQFQFQLLPHVDPNLALADVRQAIADEFGPLSAPREERLKRNGLAVFSLEAAARYDDRPVRLWLALVESPSKRQGLFIAFVDVQAASGYEGEVRRILAGVAPIKAPERKDSRPRRD
jgi:predicted Zn-dependent protease